MKNSILFVLGFFALSACGSNNPGVVYGATNLEVNLALSADSELLDGEVTTCGATPTGTCKNLTSNSPGKSTVHNLPAATPVVIPGALVWNDIGCLEGEFAIVITCESDQQRDWFINPYEVVIKTEGEGTYEANAFAFLQGNSTVIIGDKCNDLPGNTTPATDALGDVDSGLVKETADVVDFVDVCDNTDAFNVERADLDGSLDSGKGARDDLKACMDDVGSVDPDFEAATTAFDNLVSGIGSANVALFNATTAVNACGTVLQAPISLPGVTTDGNDRGQALEDKNSEVDTADNGLWDNEAVCGVAGDEVCTPDMVQGPKAELENLRNDCSSAVTAINDTVDIAVGDPRSVCGANEDEVCDSSSTQVVDALAAAERCRQAITDSNLVDDEADAILLAYNQMGELVVTVANTSFNLVEGAVITATYGGDVRTGVTDSDGVTVVRLPPNQPYSVRIEATDYQAFLVPVPQQLNAQATVPLQVVISPL